MELVFWQRDDVIRIDSEDAERLGLDLADGDEALWKAGWRVANSSSGLAYLKRSRGRRSVPAHRVIVGFCDKDGNRLEGCENYVVDHVDGDGLNNTRSNLRIANARMNSINKIAYRLRMGDGSVEGYAKRLHAARVDEGKAERALRLAREQTFACEAELDMAASKKCGLDVDDIKALKSSLLPEPSKKVAGTGDYEPRKDDPRPVPKVPKPDLAQQELRNVYREKRELEAILCVLAPVQMHEQRIRESNRRKDADPAGMRLAEKIKAIRTGNLPSLPLPQKPKPRRYSRPKYESIRKLLRESPELSNQEIARRVPATPSYVSQVAAQLRKKTASKPKPVTELKPVTEAHVLERVRKLRQLIDRDRSKRRRTTFFWDSYREKKLRRLLDGGQFAEANELLDTAAGDYRRGPKYVQRAREVLKNKGKPV